ncbi:hypothetical protein [Taibaiella chishuiensis]|uniref:Uncharacterized protein n=1 Tax=Taibaiella chishuiensis TaxID=1434707 RepID=A0A2P8CYT2_9BACT|nr:hypothetical protein [Taibaiella chishuiensis]PSK90132.1 hypothetical protein B0I18_109138 [Taibaiella chishuiensis]
MRYTKWEINNNEVILHPNGAFKLMGIMATLICGAFAAFFLIQMQQYGKDPGFTIPFVILLLLPGIILFLGGNTRIVFDDGDRTMKRYLFGFLKNKTVNYDDIAAIESYGSHSTGMNYRIFLRENRHGRGIRISSGYAHSAHAAAMVFRRELIPILEQRIKAGASRTEPAIDMHKSITGFTFYRNEGSRYVVKASRIFPAIMGLIFLSWGVYALATGAGRHSAKASDAFFLTYFPVLLGLVFLVTCFNKTIFDKAERKIILSYAGGIYKKEYFFGDFIRYLIVRKTTNLIYSGTDVRMELQPVDKNKSVAITIHSFSNTRKIERFIEETNSIMDKI